MWKSGSRMGVVRSGFSGGRRQPVDWSGDREAMRDGVNSEDKWKRDCKDELGSRGSLLIGGAWLADGSSKHWCCIPNTLRTAGECQADALDSEETLKALNLRQIYPSEGGIGVNDEETKSHTRWLHNHEVK